MPLNIEQLPAEVRDRILTKRREAFESELKKIGDRIDTEGAWHRSGIEAEFQQIFNKLNQEAASGREKELADLKKYESETLAALKMEALKRRNHRLKNGNHAPAPAAAGAAPKNGAAKPAAAPAPAQKLTGLQALLNATPPPPTGAAPPATPHQADNDAFALSQSQPEAAAAAPPPQKADEEVAKKVKLLVKSARGHMSRNDTTVAAKMIAEALELDPFNRDVLELDAKIREAQESDTFVAASPTTSLPKAPDHPVTKADKAAARSAMKANKTAMKAKKSAALIGQKRKTSRVIPILVTTVVLGLVGVGILYRDQIPVIRLHDGITLAVLPWTSPERGTDVEAASTSLPELLNSQLMRSGSSSARFLGFKTALAAARNSRDPEGIIRSYGFTHILRGNISRLGSKDSVYVISVELTDSMRTTVWSRSYERRLADLAGVPYEISASLQQFIGGDSAAALPPGGSFGAGNAEAFGAYLRGLHLLHGQSRASIDGAITAFTMATDLDSLHAGSYAGLSTALLRKSRMETDGTAELLAGAQLAAEKALHLSPEHPEGYSGMAAAYIDRKLFDSALTVLDAAGQRTTIDPEIIYLRAMATFLSGDMPRAHQEIEDAARFDPRNPDILNLRATVLQLGGDFTAAARERLALLPLVDDSIAYLTGSFADIMMLEPSLMISNRERVVAAYRARLADRPGDYDGHYRYGRLLAASGGLQEGLKHLRSLETRLRDEIAKSPENAMLRLSLALTLTRLGEYSDAVAIGEISVKKFPDVVEAKYVLAQVYAMQMYSTKTKSVDEHKLARAMNLLREAVAQGYRENLLLSADFYHLHERADMGAVLGPERPVTAVAQAGIGAPSGTESGSN